MAAEDLMESGQQSFELTESDWRAPQYFVPHSGAAAAITELETIAPIGWIINGPHGVGKSHFLRLALDNYPGRFQCFDWSRSELANLADIDADIRRFIAAYEGRKKGGEELLLAFPASGDGEDIITNPHVASRLSSFNRTLLTLPSDLELLPLINSILERRNIRLDPGQISQLVSRVPANPLSLTEILIKIDSKLASAGLGVAKNFRRTLQRSSNI